MEGGNVAVVRRAFAAIERRDASALLELSHPDVELESLFGDLSGGRGYRGRDGVRQYLADLSEAFEFGELRPEQFLSVGDVVLTVGTIRFRGAASGVEGDMAAGWLWRLRAGRIAGFRAFRDPEEALARIAVR